MTKYFNHGRTLVLVVNSIADISTPTLAELAAGHDVTHDLWALTVTPSTSTVDRTRWKSPIEQSAPTRYSYDIRIGGYRHIMQGDEILWPLCAQFAGYAHLVIRRGPPYVVPLAAGQPVEVYQGRWGKRGSVGADAAGAFEVPFFPTAADDEATVAA